MKKILMAMLAITAMFFAGCGKEFSDKSIVDGLDEYASGDPVVATNPYPCSIEKIDDHGHTLDLYWPAVQGLSSNDKVQYELWMSSDDGATWIQFPKQDTLNFHFSKSDLIQCDGFYLFKVATYYYYRGDRRIFSSEYEYHAYNSTYFKQCWELHIVWSGNKVIVMNSYDEDFLSPLYDSAYITYCNVDENNKVKEVLKKNVLKSNNWIKENKDNYYDYELNQNWDYHVLIEYFKGKEYYWDYMFDFTEQMNKFNEYLLDLEDSRKN